MVDATLAVHVLRVHHLGVVVVVEDVHQAAAIPVVCHPTSVVDVTGRVFQHLGNDVMISTG